MDRLQHLLEFYDDDPDDAFTRFALAQEYLNRDEPEKALSFFEELVETDPDYAAIATYEAGIEVAREQRAQKDLSELQDARLAAKGVGFDD
jgi:thioredoxin-like negative regulator of GroEL